MGKVKHMSMLPSSWKTALAHFYDDSEQGGFGGSSLYVQSSVAQSTLPKALQQFCQLYHTLPILGQFPTH